MAEKQKLQSPPYASFGSFMSFATKLREEGVPNRVDKSVFGNASGSMIYSVISSLKSLRLIDESGVPSEAFKSFILAQDADRPALLKSIVEQGYPTLFQKDVQLEAMTSGQFDEHMRKTFEVSGATLDRIAQFFISAAKDAGIKISQQLIKRRPVYTSSSGAKDSKQKKASAVGSAVDGPSQDAKSEQGVIKTEERQKALEYQLIDLMSEPGIDDEVKKSIWSLVQYLTARKAKQK
jgi:hypothetical protein